MLISFKKKGNLIETVLSPFFILLVILVVVFWPLLNYTTSLGSSSYFERELLTRDLGLLIESMQASPNDVELQYNVKTKQLSMIIEDGIVKAYPYDVKPETSPGLVTGFKINPSNVKIIKSSIGPIVKKDDKGKEYTLEYGLNIQKSGDKIIILKNDQNIPESKSSVFEFIDTFEKDWKKAEDISVYFIEDALDSNEISKNLCKSLVIKNAKFSTPTSKCEIGTVSKRSCNDANMIIIFIESNIPKNKINLYYYGDDNNQLRAKKLASIILNKLTIDFSDFNSNVEGEYEKLLNFNELSGCLDVPVIIIEVSSVSDMKTVLTLSGLIFNSLGDYYTK